MKAPKITLSVAGLVGANLLPLGGVVLLGWDAAAILLLYWTENVVLGFYNVLKMATVKVDRPSHHLGKLLAIPFFCIHFGGFCAVHGFFLLTFFKLGKGLEWAFPKRTWPGHLVFLQLLTSVIRQLWESRPPGMEWPVLALLVSHGLSFVHNYLLKKEYACLTIEKLMGQPYQRIMLLHVAIVAGGAPVMLLGSPVPLLVILVGGKIAMDILLHTRSHRSPSDKAAKQRGSPQARASGAGGA